jgi:SAM-dependent methyltransferase
LTQTRRIINRSDADFDSASFIDPIGRVFHLDGEVYRAFFPGHSRFYREFLKSPEAVELMGAGKLVGTEEEPGLEVEGFELVVKHRRVPFPSYCYEWPIPMLKDAALLTLELCTRLSECDIVLQDATPDNIFFDSVKPVFIDFSSFMPSGGDYLWAPYQQFCNFFLFPLYLYSSGSNEIVIRLLRDCTRGVSSTDASSILGPLGKLRAPGYLKRVFLPELLNRFFGGLERSEKVKNMSSNLSRKVDLKKTRAAFFRNLLKDVNGIALPEPSSHWSDYYCKTDAETLGLKTRAVARVLEELAPATVLDIGCNTGEFSVLAAKSGASVVAFDNDHESVGQLYLQAKEQGLDILPLLVDVLNPSPSMGWRGRQYKCAHDRFKCDTVLALALIHHMVFAGGQDFGRSIESIGDFTDKHLIIEFVSIDDPMSRLLKRRPGIDYGWYTLEGFMETLGEHFSSVTVIEKLNETRTLLLAVR